MSARLRYPLIVLLFFLTGAAGLLYEVVWVRALGVVVGSEATAVNAVLSAYFAGAAVGAWIIAKHGDKSSSPLVFYARLEFGVGVAGGQCRRDGVAPALELLGDGADEAPTMLDECVVGEAELLRALFLDVHRSDEGATLRRRTVRDERG
jgi:hypothetical protein